MTIEELALSVGEHPLLISGVLATPPLLALLAMIGGRDPAGAGPRRYLFMTLVYLVCVPGVMAAVITAYALLFDGVSLLSLDILAYFGPVVSMVLTLMLIARTTPLERVPGFGRIGGLVLTLAAAFFIAFFLQRMQIWVVFVGGMGALLILGLVLFIAIRIGVSRAFGSRKDEPRRS